MIERVIIAGSGGQGIMLLGKVLAEAAMREDRHVTWLPSYGAEVRGGTAHCMVTVSDAGIGSPYIDQAGTLIIMNEPSLERFQSRIENNGLLIINSSLVRKNIKTKSRLLKFPFTEIALRLGNIKVANMAALGCYINHKNIVSAKSIIQVICEIAPPDKKGLIEINTKALEEGMRLK